MANLFGFNDFDFKGKTVGLRADLNLPYDARSKTLSEAPRLRDHVKTIQELTKRGAKVVVMAHQGRKGDEDFITLEKHAKILEKFLGQPVRFISLDSNFGEIKNMNPGEVALLDNVRIFDDETTKKSIEEHQKSTLTKKLGPLLDYFVLDAFSVAHRAHASVVGFCLQIPCIQGPVFSKEHEFLQRFLKEISFSKNDVFVLGGAKPDEPINMLERLYGKGIEKVLTAGVISMLLLKARGYNLGKSEEFLKEKGYLEYMDKISKFTGEKEIYTPIDFAIEKLGKRVEIDIKTLPVQDQILDIGQKTIEEYRKIILDANVVCMKGPAGVYEKKEFSLGTQKLFEAIADSECISLIGGGNSTDAMELLKVPTEFFTYVSLSGGAFVEFLTGVELPGIKALELSAGKFRNI